MIPRQLAKSEMVARNPATVSRRPASGRGRAVVDAHTRTLAVADASRTGLPTRRPPRGTRAAAEHASPLSPPVAVGGVGETGASRAGPLERPWLGPDRPPDDGAQVDDGNLQDHEHEDELPDHDRSLTAGLRRLGRSSALLQSLHAGNVRGGSDVSPALKRTSATTHPASDQRRLPRSPRGSRYGVAPHHVRPSARATRCRTSRRSPPSTACRSVGTTRAWRTRNPPRGGQQPTSTPAPPAAFQSRALLPEHTPSTRAEVLLVR